jgi:site-specific DNA-cytosine methylase
MAVGWDLFSGIGGVKCGMQEAGIDPVLGVECDPFDRQLSEAFKRVHELNGWHGTRIQTVEGFADWGCPGLSSDSRLAHKAKIGHFSPVCGDFSNANRSKVPTRGNMEMAAACMVAVELGQPENFTMEQVPLYEKSPEFAFIRDQAFKLGYSFNYKSLNIGAAFGQSRQRLIVTASRVGEWRSPQQAAPRSWYEVIADLIPAFDPIIPTPRQIESARHWYATHPDQLHSPLYVERLTSGKDPKSRGRNELIPTVTKSKFRDGSKNGRSKVSCIYLPGDQVWLNLSLEAYARLCGFPDTFRYPNDYNVVGSGFGYAVPPLFYASLLKTMPEIMS